MLAFSVTTNFRTFTVESTTYAAAEAAAQTLMLGGERIADINCVGEPLYIIVETVRA